MFRNRSLVRTRLEMYPCSTCGARPAADCKTSGGAPSPPHKAREQAYQLSRIEAMLKPEQVEASRTILEQIRKERIPAIAFVHTEDSFSKLVVESCWALLAEVKETYADNAALVAHGGEKFAAVIERIAAIDWLRFMLENTE